MILHGRDLQITTAADGVLVALAQSCEIDVECDEIEVTSSTNGDWRDFIAGRKSWVVNVGYLMTAGNVASDVLKIGTVVNIKVNDGDTGTPLIGTALVKTCKVSGAVRNLSKGSFQFRGKGPLAPVTT